MAKIQICAIALLFLQICACIFAWLNGGVVFCRPKNSICITDLSVLSAMANRKAARTAEKKQSNPTPSPQTPAAWWPWALAGLSFVLFATGFQNDMVSMDDHTATIDNPAVTNFDLFGHFNLGMYAPVTWAVYGFAYIFGKDSPFWYHFFGALVHALNVVLVFRLLKRLHLSEMPALIATFFFAIHPMQVEAVSWIAALSTPLAVLFMLLAIDFYLQYAQSPEQKGAKYAASLAFFVLGCLSKSIAVSVALALLVLDFWSNRPITRRSLWEKAPYFALALGFGLLTLYSRTQAGHGNTPANFSILDRGLMAFHTIAFYWIKLIFPVGLSIWYPFIKTGNAWDWTYYVAPFLVVGVYVLAYRSRGQFPILWYGLLFYLVHIVFSLPFATFGTFELRSDRYNYLACLGIFVVLAYLPYYVKDKKPSLEGASWGLLVLLSLFWVFNTSFRIKDWRNTVTLIDKAIEASGDNFGRAYLWRGMEYGDEVGKSKDRKTAEQKVNLAIQDFTKAISINPNLAEAYKYRGGLYGITKQYEQSVADISQYLAQNPNDAEYYYNRGLSQLNLKRFPEAIQDFSKTIELRPDFERAYKARGNAYITQGDTLKGNADLEVFRQKTGQIN
jgi:tetratricopeptide (TPR) repeat protein